MDQFYFNKLIIKFYYMHIPRDVESLLLSLKKLNCGTQKRLPASNPN